MAWCTDCGAAILGDSSVSIIRHRELDQAHRIAAIHVNRALAKPVRSDRWSELHRILDLLRAIYRIA